MRISLLSRFRWLVVVGLVLSALVPAIASASPLWPPDFEGTLGVGHSPLSPRAINGTVRNTLAPGQSAWFETAYGGPAPLGVTVNYDPANVPPAGTIQMHVDWTTPTGMANVDWPGYYRVGEGTTSGFAQGVLFWMTSDHPTAHYFVELVNNSTVPIGYAIAVTGSQNPPPVLNPAPPGAISYPQ